MAYFLNFRYWTISGPTRRDPELLETDGAFKASPLDQRRLRSAIAGQDVLLATHGYDNRQRDGLCALTRLEAELVLPPSATFIGVLWPGDSFAWKAGYPTEKRTAEACGRYLARFCNSSLTAAASISLVSHSLGARLVLEAVRHLGRRARTVCLTAAAIERNCLAKEYDDAFANADTVSVLASHSDIVLRYAFPVGNLVAHALDPTGNPLSLALGYRGPPAPIGNTVRPWQTPDGDSYGHGDYLPPSDPADPFPMPDAKWSNSAGFIRRSFLGSPQTWPPG